MGRRGFIGFGFFFRKRMKIKSKVVVVKEVVVEFGGAGAVRMWWRRRQ